MVKHPAGAVGLAPKLAGIVLEERRRRGTVDGLALDRGLQAVAQQRDRVRRVDGGAGGAGDVEAGEPGADRIDPEDPEFPLVDRLVEVLDQRVRVRGRGRIIVQSRTEIGAQREHGVETAVGGGGCDECVLVVGVVARLVEIVLEINPGRGKLFRVQWLLALHLAALLAGDHDAVRVQRPERLVANRAGRPENTLGIGAVPGHHQVAVLLLGTRQAVAVDRDDLPGAAGTVVGRVRAETVVVGFGIDHEAVPVRLIVKRLDDLLADFHRHAVDEIRHLLERQRSHNLDHGIELVLVGAGAFHVDQRGIAGARGGEQTGGRRELRLAGIGLRLNQLDRREQAGGRVGLDRGTDDVHLEAGTRDLAAARKFGPGRSAHRAHARFALDRFADAFPLDLDLAQGLQRDQPGVLAVGLGPGEELLAEGVVELRPGDEDFRRQSDVVHPCAVRRHQRHADGPVCVDRKQAAGAQRDQETVLAADRSQRILRAEIGQPAECAADEQQRNAVAGDRQPAVVVGSADGRRTAQERIAGILVELAAAGGPLGHQVVVVPRDEHVAGAAAVAVQAQRCIEIDAVGESADDEDPGETVERQALDHPAADPVAEDLARKPVLQAKPRDECAIAAEGASADLPGAPGQIAGQQDTRSEVRLYCRIGIELDLDGAHVQRIRQLGMRTQGRGIGAEDIGDLKQVVDPIAGRKVEATLQPEIVDVPPVVPDVGHRAGVDALFILGKNAVVVQAEPAHRGAGFVLEIHRAAAATLADPELEAIVEHRGPGQRDGVASGKVD